MGLTMFNKISFEKNNATRLLSIIGLSMALIACGGEETETEAEGATNQNVTQQAISQPLENAEQELGTTQVEQNEIVEQIEYIPHQQVSEEVVEEPVVEESVVEEVQEEVVEEVVQEEVVEVVPQPEEEVIEPVLSSIELNWEIPSFREDGSDLELFEIEGYVIAYGTESGNLTNTVDVIGSGQTSAVIDELEAGTYYFAIATIDSEGGQGAYSAEVEQLIL